MKQPIVAIVGRPNVGKSTLFNRLTGKSDAIVDDLSGVTRDRKYGEVNWSGKLFRLIDTGGYVPDSLDLFEKAIREQVEIAVEESDAIIFVVDAKSGLLPFDKEIASMLRASSKDVFLVVNKIDTEKDEAKLADFYSLGLDPVYDLSAAVGRKIGDFLDVIINALPFLDNEGDGDTRLKLALVGRPNVGKSSLTNALLGHDRSIVTDVPGTTRDSIDSTLKYYGEEIILIDTAGLRKKKKVNENVEFYSTIRTLKSIAECHVAIVLIDAKLGIEKQDLKIIQEAIDRRKGIIIAVNKWDLVEKDSNTAKKFEDEIREQLGGLDYIPIIFISALTKKRIFNVIELAKTVYAERNKKIPTNELNDIMLAEINNMPPPATATGKEIKIKYVTQATGSYPVFLFFANEAKHIPANYKRYLEKAIRKNFGFTGVTIILSFKAK
jgi:GTP-binding protein